MASLSLLMTLVAVLLLVVAPAWGCEKENCETSNLLQTHRVDAAGAKLEGDSALRNHTQLHSGRC